MHRYTETQQCTTLSFCLTDLTLGGWWRWALLSLDGVAPSRMVGVSASVNLPLHHKVQKFSSGTGSHGWSRKKGHKTVVVWCGVVMPLFIRAAPGWGRVSPTQSHPELSYVSLSLCDKSHNRHRHTDSVNQLPSSSPGGADCSSLGSSCKINTQ